MYTAHCPVLYIHSVQYRGLSKGMKDLSAYILCVFEGFGYRYSISRKIKMAVFWEEMFLMSLKVESRLDIPKKNY